MRNGRPVVAIGVAGLVLVVTACGSLTPRTSRVESSAAQTSTASTGTPTAGPTTASASPLPSPPSASPDPTAPTPWPTRTTSSAPPPKGPARVIVIDPGHSGRSIRSTDQRTGLRDIDYPNYPEIYETFDVSACLGQGLRADGYRVVLTKTRALDSVSLARRAAIADEAKADLAISVHDDHGQGPGFQATYDQRGRPSTSGAYHAMYRGKGSHRTVFDRPAVARASQRAAITIARERSRVQGRRVSVEENIYTGRAPLEPGNLALVQLLTSRPWVYNELGAKTAGSTRTAMSISSETGYATGLLVGIEAAVPLVGGRVDQPSSGAELIRSCLVDQVRSGRDARPRSYLPYRFPR